MGWSEQFRDPTGTTYFIDEDGVSHPSWEDLILSGLFDFCGCGLPEYVLHYLYHALRIIRRGDYPERCDDIDELFHGNAGAEFLVWYELDRVGLTEHGVGVASAWLTEKGKAVLEDMDHYLGTPSSWFPQKVIHEG